MALTTNQRTTIRNGFITLYNSDPSAWSHGGELTAAQFADQWLALLDEYRAQTRPRGHYTMRVAPWIAARMGFSTTLRNAITTHVNGG